jgi:hypothetical protein
MFSKRLVGLLVIACLLFCFSAAQAADPPLGSATVDRGSSGNENCESFIPWVGLDGFPEVVLFEDLTLLEADKGKTFFIENDAHDPDFSNMALALTNGIDNYIGMGKLGNYGIKSESSWFGKNPDFKGYKITAFSLKLEEIDFEETPNTNSINPCLISYKYKITVYGIPQAAAIPTLSEWGMIILALLMAGTAIVFVKKREMAA